MFILKMALWVAFFACALVLSGVILLQEGKGGGLAEAFGGVGAETFGVRAGGINKFTFGVAAAWMASALALHATWAD